MSFHLITAVIPILQMRKLRLKEAVRLSCSRTAGPEPNIPCFVAGCLHLVMLYSELRPILEHVRHALGWFCHALGI